MNSRVVPVGLIVSYLQELIDGDSLVSDIWIEGEVSQVFRARSGHVYFTLKEEDTALKCVLFRGYADRQPRLPEVGDNLAAHGRIGLYERDGAIQLYADVVQAAGAGVLALQLEQLRQRLEQEGLFEPSRKRPLPARPRRIGVVTSPDGSVWHDIRQVLERRYPLVDVVLAPAPVQGDRAPEALIRALKAIQAVEGIDVVIIGRGGGSAEDLAAFNDERLARAVFASPIPVISAVGHETDWTIIDWVADLRAATPSVAAELSVPSRIDLAEQLRAQRRRLELAANELTRSAGRWLLDCTGHMQRHDPAAALPGRRRDLQHQRELIERAGKSLVSRRLRVLERQRSVLETLAPNAVLERGYALVSNAEDHAVISRSAMVLPHQELRLSFIDNDVVVRAGSEPPSRHRIPGASHAS